MQTITVLGVVGFAGLVGCASAPTGVTSMQAQSVGAISSVRMGHALVLDARVDPAVGVRVASEADGLVFHFSHLGAGPVERLETGWVDTTAEGADVPDPASSAPSQAQHVVIDGGSRFIAVWKSGDPARGYRAMAQSFDASANAPLGASVAISPFNVDVCGPLSAATYDGHHVVVAFAAFTHNAYAAYAVPLETL